MNSTKRDQYADQKIDVEEVISSHTNLVKKIAWHIYGRASHAIEIEDLIQIGYAALVNAAHQYTKRDGATFATYASIRIRGDIIDHLRKALRRWSIISPLILIEAYVAKVAPSLFVYWCAALTRAAYPIWIRSSISMA